MTQRTSHICRCGKRAVVEKIDTGEWLCLECAAHCIADDIEQGKPVAVNIHEIGLNDIVVAPRGDGKVDLLVALPEVKPTSIYCN